MKNKGATILLVLMIAAFIGAVAADRYHMPKFKQEFSKVEKQRVITSNKLTTAKIVQENLNHVRELVFNNMDFPGQPDTVDHETLLYNFITTCLNDLKLKLVSFKPVTPVTAGRVTTYGYDVEIEGDFFKFGELCAKFENSRRIMAIESFDVDLITDNRNQDPKASAAAVKDIRVKMRINTFRIQKV
ncbi:MAG: type 4a pilus biogenesis protein PilO [Chitinispirillia bacterium]|nr:type 4a pilus biogenesis protein PilO [Chitinispirillia bacterium]